MNKPTPRQVFSFIEYDAGDSDTRPKTHSAAYTEFEQARLAMYSAAQANLDENYFDDDDGIVQLEERLDCEAQRYAICICSTEGRVYYDYRLVTFAIQEDL